MRKALAIAALVLFLHPNISAKAEDRDYFPSLNQIENTEKTKNAQKVIAFLGAAGIYSDTMKDVAYFIDARSDDGYLNITEEELGMVKINLQYEMTKPSIENIQVKLTTEELPSWQVKATPRGAFLNYRYEF